MALAVYLLEMAVMSAEVPDRAVSYSQSLKLFILHFNIINIINI